MLLPPTTETERCALRCHIQFIPLLVSRPAHFSHLLHLHPSSPGPISIYLFLFLIPQPVFQLQLPFPIHTPFFFHFGFKQIKPPFLHLFFLFPHLAFHYSSPFSMMSSNGHRPSVCSVSFLFFVLQVQIGQRTSSSLCHHTQPN
jgi:hypothetical protein